MSSTDSLLIGPAKIFVGAANSTDIDAADIAALKAGSVPSGWTYAGDTTSGVTIKDTPEYAKATSQQTMRTLDVAVTAVTTTIASTAREITIQLLKDITRGTSTGTSSATVTPGGVGPTPKFAVAIVGNWPGGDMLFVAPRCSFVGERTLTLDANEYSQVEFEIEVLETSASGYGHGYKVFVETSA